MARNFRLSEEVCKRIPNVKKLGLSYRELPRGYDGSSYYCPQNLCRFHKLESLTLKFEYVISWRPMLLNMTFPSSQKKLTLRSGDLCWCDLEMIGSLPYLQVLKHAFSITFEWNTVEGQFQSLKFLEIHCSNLSVWNAEHFHFPVLEKLVLGLLSHLDEIPTGIGDTLMLRSIHLTQCSKPCALSAVKILEEQEGLGNQDLLVDVAFSTRYEKGPDIFKEMVEQEGGGGLPAKIFI